MACYGAAGSSWVRGGASTTAWQGPWRLFPQRSRRDAADEEAAGQRGLSRSSGGRGAADAEGVWAARGLTVLCPQSAHMAMVDALMMAYTVEMISIEKVVASVERFSTFSASKELPYDLEDAMVFWVNKVRPGRLRARGGRGAGAGRGAEAGRARGAGRGPGSRSPQVGSRRASARTGRRRRGPAAGHLEPPSPRGPQVRCPTRGCQTVAGAELWGPAGPRGLPSPPPPRRPVAE